MRQDWISIERELSSAALTLMAQTVDPLNMDAMDMFLRFFPFADVSSTEINELGTIDFRPVADRREWNAPGRLIPIKTPDLRGMEFTPTEAYHIYDERAINKLAQRFLGDESLIRQQLKADIPGRTMELASAVWRRALLDAMTAWSQGLVTIRNPQTDDAITASYNMDAGRYQTAATVWSDVSLNAYNEFTAWLDEGESNVGAIKGAVMRRATQNAILADAPELPNGVKMTRGQLADRISNDVGYAFEFAIVENTVDVFPDGGIVTVPTNIWPAGVIAAIPAGDAVGSMARAPVYRSGSLVPGLGPDDFDERGVSIFTESQNHGKTIEIQAQANWFPVPSEQKVWVIDAL